MRDHLSAVFIRTFLSICNHFANLVNLSLDYVQDENISSQSQCRIESSSNLSGRSLRNMMLRSRTFSEGKLSTSCSEPNIANAFWRRSQRRGVAEEPRGASSRFPISTQFSLAQFDLSFLLLFKCHIAKPLLLRS